MRAKRLALLSLGVALLVLLLKALAYGLTGSLALLSDALESTINVLAAGLAYLALRVALRPPDQNHPYGHTKAEYFSAVAEGVFILGAALLIAKEALPRLLDPKPLEGLSPGLGVNLLATGMNALLAWHLIRQGQALRSPALVADGQHILADVLSSLGVAAGVGLAGLTGFWILDPLLALLMAGQILYLGLRLVRRSVGGLMDEALPPEELRAIEEALKDLPPGVLEIHDLKARQAGQRAFLEFHLVVPGGMRVEEAHALCDRLERRLKEARPGLEVVIHVEPEAERQGEG